MNYDLREEERQGIVLAIAKLSLSRPGWDPGFLRPLADKLHAIEMYDDFRRMGPDQPALVAAASLIGANIDEESDSKTIDVMARFGGSFVKALAEAASRADPINLAKIKAAFPELWRDYEAKHAWLDKPNE